MWHNSSATSSLQERASSPRAWECTQRRSSAIESTIRRQDSTREASSLIKSTAELGIYASQYKGNLGQLPFIAESPGSARRSSNPIRLPASPSNQVAEWAHTVCHLRRVRVAMRGFDPVSYRLLLCIPRN